MNIKYIHMKFYHVIVQGNQIYGSSSICINTAYQRTYSCGSYVRSGSPQCVLQTTYTVNSSNQFVLWLQSMYEKYLCTYACICIYFSIDKAYSCKDGHAFISCDNLMVSCPPADVVLSRATPISDTLPILLSAVTFKLPFSIYQNNYIHGEIYTYVRNCMYLTM